MTEADVYRFMAGWKLGVLGTLGPDNAPQSAVMGFAVTEDLEIIFDTVKHSRKYPNLIERPRCSFAIGGDCEKTVQFEGEAEELKGAELEKYQKIYFAAWPDGPSRLNWPGIVYFVVRPRWIRYSDFNERPPLIREFRFGATS